MSTDGADWRRRFTATLGALVDRADAAALESVDRTAVERALWGLVAVSLVGDVATTFLGLHLGLVESNPVARGVIRQHGIGGMVGLKLAAVGVAVGCRYSLDDRHGPVVPVCLGVPWFVAVLVNVYVISTVV